MNLTNVIQQLRAYCPSLAGRVAGAADFAAGLESTVNMELPAAYVIPLDEEAEPNPAGPGLLQHVTERIGVIVEFDNSADRRGQGPAMSYDAMRAEIFAAILNWRPDLDESNPSTNREAQGFYYGGGQLREFDRARLFYQWEFCLDTLVTDADGWQVNARPLAELDITLRQDNGAEPGATMHIPIPQ